MTTWLVFLCANIGNPNSNDYHLQPDCGVNKKNKTKTEFLRKVAEYRYKKRSIPDKSETFCYELTWEVSKTTSSRGIKS